MQAAEFRRLTELRLAEADTLIAARQHSGAYYLLGLALECALKVCIARRTRRHEFPSKERAWLAYSHNFRQLVDVAALGAQLDAELAADPEFAVNWTAATAWRNDSRYEVTTRANVLDLQRALTEPHHGVLQWVRRHW